MRINSQIVIYLIQDNNSYNIPHEQRERISCTLAEVLPVYSTHYVCVLVYKLEEIFQAPEETFAAA